MSKSISVAAFISSLFGKSHKTISEKLSTEEFNEFSEDATELNNRLTSQTDANKLLVDDLAKANASVAELTTKLTTSTTSLTAVTSERDKYKAHYDLIKGKGDNEGGEDDNSRKTDAASYNQHALEVWNKAHAKA